ncbi:conjugal transfer protein TraF [Thioalkalivibrio sp. ALMg11]|uniref:conjugal transfer protein TraF n=1 Tax=Thioalkalivibrio sp. ALMg11 TaxID=1158165 RepID=UPI00039B5B12|nr:conjugal transfer protein TraF [Thioalkalivibrio sp. ALMg11]
MRITCKGWVRGLLMAGVAASVGLAQANPGTSSGFYGDRERGWFWYEQPPEPPKPPEPEPEPEIVPIVPELSARERLEALQEEIEEAKALAILEPTQENIAAYLEMQDAMMNRSMVFADTWRRTLWDRPDLDYSTERPVVQSGVREQRRIEDREIAQAVDHVRDERGLVFFYMNREECPYCEVQSRHVERFARENNLTVRAITLDGSTNEYFPEARQDDGLAEAFGVQEAPGLFLVNPVTGEVDSVGYGVIDDAELGKRLRRIVSLEIGEF